MPKQHRVTKVRTDRTALEKLIHSPEVQTRLDEVARVIEMRQQYAVPVDTGELKSKIEVRVHAPSGGRLIGVWGVDYALPVEFGHHTQSGTWVPAQPYLRPSLGGI